MAQVQAIILIGGLIFVGVAGLTAIAFVGLEAIGIARRYNAEKHAHMLHNQDTKTNSRKKR